MIITVDSIAYSTKVFDNTADYRGDFMAFSPALLLLHIQLVFTYICNSVFMDDFEGIDDKSMGKLLNREKWRIKRIVQ